MRTITLIGLLLISQLSFAADTPAPDFTLKSTAGKNLRLSEMRGQVVLVNFWASWCGPCRQEMPLLDDLHNKYSKLGFTVLGVNVDKSQAAADKILKDIPVTFPVLYDPKGTVSQQYNVSAMPTTIIIDRNGNMRYSHKGFKPGYEDKYATNIKALIRE
ncbi:TlpA family protein disulfide reductase [Oceanicoccus sagamiensis]|uniref:Redoxin n=1 Tax=Oceanicoccus sagamiensis TaxID=716816 RepID=A0A1X9N6K1_9GAMM|nr:TlpA disulfide reductase family protein [Oceanicoccus sagamiensis]ARN72794.1 redoxin [Oceanicoccus sagamiensis]